MINDERPHQDLTDRRSVCWIDLKCVFYQLMKVLREVLRKSFVGAVEYLCNNLNCAYCGKLNTDKKIQGQ